jgi:hypothetical protein
MVPHTDMRVLMPFEYRLSQGKMRRICVNVTAGTEREGGGASLTEGGKDVTAWGKWRVTFPEQ